MKHDERDPVAALREAWTELAPGEPADEPADAVILAVRAELRRAWQGVEPPATVLPWRLRQRPEQHGAVWPAAVAAAVLVALGTVLWRGGGPPALPDGTAVPALSEGPRVASVTADRLELTSGNVRLVLLTQNTAPASGAASGEEPR